MDLAFEIAINFLREYRSKYHRILFQIQGVRESRWWSHFVKASSFIDKENVSEFIRYFFKQDFSGEKILPHMLVSKRGREIYNDFISSKKVEIPVDIKRKVSFTIKEVVNWCVSNNIKENKIENFVKNRTNVMKIERGTLYEPVFLFSKEYVKDRHIEDIELKRLLFKKNHRKVYEVIEKISGSDLSN